MNRRVKSIIAALAITGTILTIAPNTAKAAEVTCTNSATEEAWIKNILDKYPQLKNWAVITKTNTTTTKPVTNNTKPATPAAKPAANNTKPTTPVAKPAANNTNSTAPVTKPATNNANTTNQNSGQASNSAISAEATEVIKLVNVERSKNGLAPLKANAELSKVATAKAQDMIDKNYFSHTSPTYGSPFDMMKKFGINYSAAGENIAYGQKTPSDVMNGWMNSPGHKANILNSNFTEIGVGMVKDTNGTPYWVQMFINPGK
ncbi:hypothetical protein CPAST_c23880 [Clostridium pasteurianum DSM 525 = ATCC 6013]|uniref:Sporulation uncharacterized protein YkwD n=1 Tax=Clostridium pasteurianum DSM 525 = ATCC 6013 TaxID=1262449 RepID=A0A0H3J8Y8_CLOPA|nr:CAP domain-containing protein [Clostridium pasteurianum]AJA48458.1 hypothetical protein CPAST_c23880 [Clostridium pasteurianum DSM 525 = ATCC 6013]AJA52446.1 hypothetical protein CLPA_c23880 [Clostridium pasteurianum DSM 525 = ATCC 6013]AOZ75700.1 serine protease [Clostridium pasteurianum DSM 525 = ATCC 6013]AOZ79496.1 serine protease [Clostridium pasteurianum]ELP60394.1 hypothetical protein F502_02877 [Clostridium pasteurianum DSM 525 = ATCC 6013]